MWDKTTGEPLYNAIGMIFLPVIDQIIANVTLNVSLERYKDGRNRGQGAGQIARQQQKPLQVDMRPTHFALLQRVQDEVVERQRPSRE